MFSPVSSLACKQLLPYLFYVFHGATVWWASYWTIPGWLTSADLYELQVLWLWVSWFIISSLHRNFTHRLFSSPLAVTTFSTLEHHPGKNSCSTCVYGCVFFAASMTTTLMGENQHYQVSTKTWTLALLVRENLMTGRCKFLLLIWWQPILGYSCINEVVLMCNDIAAAITLWCLDGGF